ncbi:MAG TPA: TIM barrel protein [Pirellulales bacterium]|nr:TIM barrel protein [Pirellulales bacterium]
MSRFLCDEIVSRRTFVSTVVGAACAGAAGGLAAKCGWAADPPAAPIPPVAVFSKLYQELKLDFEQSAAVTAEAGLDGIDCAVRAAGEIEPARAADDMPRYAEALGKHGVKMLLLTTGILGVDSPNCREILTTSKKLGIRYYRLGFWPKPADASSGKFLAEIKARLKELAPLNRELGVCALFENHSAPGTKVGGEQPDAAARKPSPNQPEASAGKPPAAGKSSGMAGGDLGELYEIVKDFDPDQIAVAFDLGHAMIMHGDEWHVHFERLKAHVKVAYIKDVGRTSRFVPFGQGEFAKSDFFTLLKRMKYSAPISMHIEYAWAPEGKKARAAMVEMLNNSRRQLGDWWERA